MVTPSSAKARLVILYGIGGLSDVGRHALLAALERKDVAYPIRVLTQHPELLDLPNWECGCPKPHILTESDRAKFELVKVNSWTNDKLQHYFQDATAVVSCLGSRQPGFFNPEIAKYYVAREGNAAVIAAMKAHQVKRAVVISSMGVEEDWPPMEFHWAGNIMSLMFQTCCRTAYQDLCLMERAYRASNNLDYLLVRPVGISEDAVPLGTWRLQLAKYQDAVGGNMAKMDVARYMVEEAIHPTRHQDAVVIGAVEEGLK